MKKYFCLVFIFGLINATYSQDTLVTQPLQKECSVYKKLILPAALVVGGIGLKYSFFQKNAHEETQEVFGQKFQFHGDDYFQYAPIAQIAVGNLLGFKSQNTTRQMMSNVLLSTLFIGSSVQLCKNILNDRRPNGRGRNSFPSGHTATAFNTATLLFLEYKDDNMWYASSGYAFAVATGILRMANNKHWLGDVVAGAGWGTGIAIIVHHWNPIFFKNKKEKNTSFIGYPVINQDTYGFGMLYQMR